MIFNPLAPSDGPFFKLDNQPSTLNDPNDGQHPETSTINTFEISSSQMDSNNQKIKQGKTYVLCIYIVTSQPYQKFTNDYHDILSAPSEPFTLATPVNYAKNFTVAVNEPQESDKPKSPKANTEEHIEKLKEHKEQSHNELYFEVVDDQLKPDTVKYRCMLLPRSPRISHQFLTDSDLPVNKFGKEGKGVKFLFNLDIAKTVSAGNYKVGKIDTKAAIANNPSNTYKVKFEDDFTDNFGSPIVPGEEYLVVVLSYVNESVDSSQYVETLSPICTAPVMKFDESFNFTMKTKSLKIQ